MVSNERKKTRERFYFVIYSSQLNCLELCMSVYDTIMLFIILPLLLFFAKLICTYICLRVCC